LDSAIIVKPQEVLVAVADSKVRKECVIRSPAAHPHKVDHAIAFVATPGIVGNSSSSSSSSISISSNESQ
jgi:hypothetical protein